MTVHWNTCITSDATQICLSILHSWYYPIIQQTSMVSDLAVLTLIPAAWHAAVNHHSMLEDTVWWGKQNHLDCENKRHNLRSSNWTHSCPQLHLEALSMKITNRINNKRQPWKRPKPIGNQLDLMPRTWTQLTSELQVISEPNWAYVSGSLACSSSLSSVRERLTSNIWLLLIHSLLILITIGKDLCGKFSLAVLRFILDWFRLYGCVFGPQTSVLTIKEGFLLLQSLRERISWSKVLSP